MHTFSFDRDCTPTMVVPIYTQFPTHIIVLHEAGTIKANVPLAECNLDCCDSEKLRVQHS